MAEGIQPSKGFNNGAVMSPAAKNSGKTRHEVNGEGKLDTQSPLPGRGEAPRRDGEAPAALCLSEPQHAQVTQAVFDQEQVGVAIAGLDGRIQRTNRVFAGLLQYSQEELTGKALESLVRGASHTHSPRERMQSPTGENRASPALNYLARKSGDAIACLVHSQAIHDDHEKVTHFMVFVSDARSTRDMEERNRFENELYRAQALQTLGLLAGGVAHDFNNALEVILGFASLARVRLSPMDPLHEPLKIIEESAKGAAGLARQLLDVSKDSSGKDEPVDTGALIDAALSIVTRTFDRKIRIEHHISSQLPFVKGSRSRLEQAILNLCINARDAMEQGGTLAIDATLQEIKSGDVRLPAAGKPGTYVRIAVRDTGEGMPAEIMEKIFVPMFTTKASGRGFGLGLAMVDRIVKESHGFISVASRPGQGSEFSLYLPAVFSNRPHIAACKPSQIVSGRGGVLVVDDEPRVLEFLAKGLTRLGYRVVTAESGSKACRIYSSKSDEIDCVLLDLIMPGMSGLEVYARLKDINPGVRVILSSGYSSGRVKREAVEAGSLEFLEKPYTLEELSQAMRKIQQN